LPRIKGLSRWQFAQNRASFATCSTGAEIKRKAHGSGKKGNSSALEGRIAGIHAGGDSQMYKAFPMARNN